MGKNEEKKLQMKLFEINAEINKLIDEMVVDETTGEIIDNTAENRNTGTKGTVEYLHCLKK